ncbi:MAG TPA: cysteine--tRNA ligase, partial [Novosphingobium sp.]|nr:cysteine--tRNA ligase [Novosphingobium sp.]
LVRLKRMVMAIDSLRRLEDQSEILRQNYPVFFLGEDRSAISVDYRSLVDRFDAAISDDLNTPLALTVFDDALAMKKGRLTDKLLPLITMDAVLGLGLQTLSRTDLRIRPKGTVITEAEIETALAARKEARAAKDFATSDRLRDELAAQGVEVMDGDPLGWDWKLG